MARHRLQSTFYVQGAAASCVERCRLQPPVHSRRSRCCRTMLSASVVLALARSGFAEANVPQPMQSSISTAAGHLGPRQLTMYNSGAEAEKGVQKDGSSGMSLSPVDPGSEGLAIGGQATTGAPALVPGGVVTTIAPALRGQSFSTTAFHWTMPSTSLATPPTLSPTRPANQAQQVTTAAANNAGLLPSKSSLPSTPPPTPAPKPAPTTPKRTIAPTTLTTTVTTTTPTAAPTTTITTTLTTTLPPTTTVTVTTFAANASAASLGEELAHPNLLPAGQFSWGTEKANVMQSPVFIFVSDAKNWLQNPASPQGMIGVVVLLIGLLMCCCGRIIWPFLFAFLVAACGACFVLYQDETIPELTPGEMGNIWLACQTGLTLFLATYLGFNGSQVVLGAVLGVAYAFMTDFVVNSLKAKLAAASFAWSCLCAGLGVVFFTVCRSSVLSTLAPLFGGMLIASGGGTLVAHLGAKELVDPVWINSLVRLLGNGGLGNFACQCAFALLGAALNAITKKETLGTLPIFVGLLFSALASRTGLGCTLIHKCPSWLVPVDKWQWPLVGGFAWMLCSAIGAFVQLKMTDSDEKRDKDTKKKKDASTKNNSKAAQQDSQHPNELQPLNGQFSSPAAVVNNDQYYEGMSTVPQMHNDPYAH